MTERGWMAGGLLALVLAAGTLGPMSRETSRMGAAIVLLILTAGWLASGPAAAHRRPQQLLVAGAGLACALLVAWSPDEGPLMVCALFLLLGAAVAGYESPAPASMRGVACGAILLSCWTLAMNRSGWAWRLADDFSRTVTGWLAGLSGASTALGASAAGLPIVVLAVCTLLAVLAIQQGTERWLSALALCWEIVVVALLWAAGIPLLLRTFLAVLAWSGGAQGSMPVRGYPASVAVYLPSLLFLLLLAPILLLAVPARRLPGVVGFQVPGLDGLRAPGAAARARIVPGAAAALMALLMCWPPARLPADPSAIRVTFRDQGMVGWEVPSVERRGLEQAGMFGMVPRYLGNAGFQVRVEADALSESVLGATDVLVVINPTKELEAVEAARVHHFVEAGGGLLVLGDHTDLAGIMAPLNALLAPYGMAVQFDSAFTPRHWRNDAGFMPGPLTRDLDDANSRFQQSTGGSLRLGKGASPVALARWGFSDAGDRNNKDNAFLGDYIYQASEPLGDLPVVAMSRSGLGRVIAFGDTSAFQNNSVPQAWPFLMRVFQVAGTRESAIGRPLAQAGLLGLAALLLMSAWRGGVWGAVVLAGALGGLALSRPVIAMMEPGVKPVDGPVALIDTAHFNDISLDLWEPRALTGLNLNLARHGYLPIVMRSWSPEWVRASDLLVCVAPRRRFSSRETAAVRSWIEAGGELLLTVGWEERSGSEPLLRMAGLDVAPVPLGPVPVLRKIADNELFRRLQMEPHFAKAWPIEGVDPARDRVLYSSDTYVIAARRPMGKGGFSLVADSRFLLNKTLEEEGAVWEGNVSFLRALLKPGAAAPATPVSQ